MTKWCRLFLLTIPMFAALVVWLEPTRVLWGTLRGEAFFQGRPTSYWARHVERWADASSRCLGVAEYTSVWDQALDYFGQLDKFPPRPTVLDHDPATLPVLAELLDCDQNPVRFYAIQALGAKECWAADAGAAPLRAALAHRIPDVRWWAAILLVRNGERGDLDRVVPNLIDAAQQGDYGDRLGALEALEKIGPPAQAAVAPLRDLRERAALPDLRAAAAKALARIESIPAVKASIP